MFLCIDDHARRKTLALIDAATDAAWTFGDLAGRVSERQESLGQAGKRLAFLFCRNIAIPFPDGSVDLVVSNSVPIDTITWLGPGIQSSEVRRLLRSGGIWRHDGIAVFSKP